MSIESITHLIYDGVLAAPAWSKALRSISQAVDAHAFHQISVARRDMGVHTVSAWLSDELRLPAKQREYEHHFAALDVRMPGMLALRAGELLLDHQRFDNSTFERTPIYTEFLASVDLRHTAAIAVRSDDDAHEVLGIMRHADQRPYEAREQTLLAHWAPHLLRANRLRHKSRQLADAATQGCRAIDTLAQCVAVLGANCHVRYLNASAEHALRNQGPLTVSGGRLRSTIPSVQHALERRVAQVCKPATGSSPPGVGVVEDTARRLALSVLPLSASHPLAAAWQAIPLALVTWRHTSERPSPQAHARLKAALGLTPTEAALALHIAQGGLSKTFAQQQGSSWFTVRAHLRNILRKTGCSSQQELMGLIDVLNTGVLPP